MNKRKWYGQAVIGIMLLLMFGCTAGPKTKDKEPFMKYTVNQLHRDMIMDGKWDNPIWRDVEPIRLTYYMGDKPDHFPKTQAKLLYDNQFVHVIFRVEDRYVRAIAQKHQDAVCRDSCVEFFFTPGTNLDAGYFNLEMNCGGIMLFHFQVIPREGRLIESADLDRIKIVHQMPTIIDPEITEPTDWTVQYRLPVDILEKYYPGAKKPAPGVTWRANFYKCADKTSHPHWLTWSKVDKPQPDFHVPEYFGALKFK